MRGLKFSPEAWSDYLYWQLQDRKTLRRINELLKDACRTPFESIGKPEPLKGNLAECWSRRIDEQHRLIYEVNDTHVTIVACRLHY